MERTHAAEGKSVPLSEEPFGSIRDSRNPETPGTQPYSKNHHMVAAITERSTF